MNTCRRCRFPDEFTAYRINLVVHEGLERGGLDMHRLQLRDFVTVACCMRERSLLHLSGGSYVSTRQSYRFMHVGDLAVGAKEDNGMMRDLMGQHVCHLAPKSNDSR